MAGERPLRKVLRYRDQSGASLEAHTDHWRGFEWEAGPVCVIHKGAAWGVPQVWAATAAEGKRVLRHAGVIAEIDVDTQGQWVVTGTLDPRYGRTGTMLVKGLANGAVSVTKREGPSALPQVATPDP
jgi:hypothetical protein